MMRRGGAACVAALLLVATFLASMALSTDEARAEAASVAADPVAIAIREAALAEPLVRTTPTTPVEDAALVQALGAHSRRANPEDLSNLSGFLTKYPRSGWAPALLTNLGLSYLHDGYFSRAIASWRKAWELGKDATDPNARRVVDRAVSELAQLYSSLGQFNEVSALLSDVGRRSVSGSATEPLQNARDLLTLTIKDPRHLFNCGPVAVRLLMLAINPADRGGDFLQWYRVGAKGTSLAELSGLAGQAKFQHRLVFRKSGQVVPLHALVHWKVGHYSAIVGEANGRYHLKDPIFPGMDHWVTRAALESEASGYFLIPASEVVDHGWRTVGAKEAAKVWGKGPTGASQTGAGHRGPKTGPKTPKKPKGKPKGKPKPKTNPAAPGKGPPPNCGGMCTYGIMESAVSLTLGDTPVGYVPPVGPSATFTITYNQREDSQPANFSYYNIGQKWTLNWLTYVVDDPANPGANVSRYLPEGGAYYYSGYSSITGRFASDEDDGSVLMRASGSPVTYRRQMDDGSVEVFAQSDGAASYPRKVFLSQVIDQQGNTVTLNYDGEMRLTSLTDAAGRQTILTYGLAAQPLLVTRITDPFGRYASFGYDASARLASITDTIGITSSFTYDANSLVNAMTTPYGTTTFAYTAPGTSGPPRYVEVTDPMGFKERAEWVEPAPISTSDPAGTVPQGMPVAPVNQYLEYRDTLYWDKDAYVAAGCTSGGGCDYAKARNTHFLHVANTSIKSPIVESIKEPLENRVWYNYPGQPNSIYTGTSSQPIAEGRVLDDGTTQLYRYAYDTTYYNLTQAIDPLGRVTNYTYSNQVDLAAVSQTTAYGDQTPIAQFTYNIHHQPLAATDAAGQTTIFTYNAAQQLVSITNPLNQTTTYHYNGTGDLTSVTNANGVTAATYTYDAFDRVATFTDSEGWTVAYAYDAADRLTKATYPDGTSEIYAYDRLDLVSYQDRLGRTWTYAYDPNRRLTTITDPVGKQTLFSYNRIDQITSQTDANSHVTQWAYDVQGRLTTTTYANSTTQTFAYETTTSRLKSVTDALSQVKSYAYAKDDAPTAITYQNAVNPTPNVSFAYDTYFPRLVSRTDGAGTTQFAYVPVGTFGALQVQQEATPLASGTISYTYDGLGRVSSRTVQGSGAQSFAYDAIGRQIGDTNELGAFTLAYLGQTGQITSRALASSNLATTWTYLPNAGDRRLASISTTGITAGQYSTFAYTSNASGQTTGTTQSSNAAISYPSASLTQTTSYNNLNQLTNLSGQALTWDADGNLLSDGTRTYSWDAENRLVGISYPGQPGKATTFSYDGLGRRIAMSSTPAGGGSATTTSFIWCGEALCQARNSGAVSRAYYNEGEYASGSGYYYGSDRLGSVRRVFTSSAAPTYDYDAFGMPLQATAPLTDFGFARMVTSVESGLNLATFRQYDPQQGRWLSRDPLGEETDPYGNLYAYAENDPTDQNDPLGLLVGYSPPPVMVAVIRAAAGQFHWHGNWGGPGYTNGGWNPESGPIPDPSDPSYVPPRDPEDVCYEGHDRCLHGCSGPDRNNPAKRSCDYRLSICLDGLPGSSKTVGSRAAAAAFRSAIPNHFH